jgi:hypothetical protein
VREKLQMQKVVKYKPMSQIIKKIDINTKQLKIF